MTKYKYLSLYHDVEQGMYISKPQIAAAFFDPSNPYLTTQRQVCGARPNTQFTILYPTASQRQKAGPAAY